MKQTEAKVEGRQPGDTLASTMKKEIDGNPFPIDRSFTSSFCLPWGLDELGRSSTACHPQIVRELAISQFQCTPNQFIQRAFDLIVNVVSA